MDDPKQIFKYKYERLRYLLKGGPEPYLLDVAAILRHLLTDGQPLVDVVNREFLLKIRFRVFRSASESAKLLAVPGATQTLIFCGTTWPPFAPLSEIKRDEFLNFDMIYWDGITFTTKEIIKLSANQLGGVHYEKDSSNPKDTLLRKINSELSMGGSSSVLASLQLIGKTTIDGLSDLYDQVIKRLNESNDSSGVTFS